MDFSNLKFGLPAAEREISKGLAEYFVESESYKRIKDREKTIILGNRGTGKTAIFKVLADREKAEGNVVLELSPEDYSYEILSSSLKAESEGAWNKHSAFAAAWKYLIYMLMMKAVTTEGKKYKRGAGANIYNYLRDRHKGFQDNPIAVLISYLKRIEGIKIGSYEASMRTRELTSLYKLEEIQPLLEDLKDLCKKDKKVLVMIDELDQGWDSSEDAKAFVSGLFQATLNINQLSENITVYISLYGRSYMTAYLLSTMMLKSIEM